MLPSCVSLLLIAAIMVLSDHTVTSTDVVVEISMERQEMHVMNMPNDNADDETCSGGSTVEYDMNDVGEDLGVPQIVRPQSRFGPDILRALQKARDYMNNIVMKEDRYIPVRETCRNQDPLCAWWSVRGECQSDPVNMHELCAPMCHGCEYLHADVLCPQDPAIPPAWSPGDLDRMFDRIAHHSDFAHYHPTVLSSPAMTQSQVTSSNTMPSTDNQTTASQYQPSDDSPAPWVITLEDFLTAEEAERLIELGALQGYERSSAGTEVQPDGRIASKPRHSEVRTSQQAWCGIFCNDDPVVERVMQRMTNLTGIPSVNAESLQLLRYQQGQFYKVHHDYLPFEAKRVPGPRILTVFMYLNDVEEGGETRFPLLNLTVKPKMGRVLLWPSVYNDRPFEKDRLTNHEALTVTKGIKYAANAWFHQYDYQDATERGCDALDFWTTFK
jgi:prolyl 4-hydroxylase